VVFLSITGIICEYNPLHLGHRKQLDFLKNQGQDIVCLMSGNYVQRGAPAIVDKMTRAEAAVRCGADLVLELPVTAALSSAEGFAAEGVRILSGFCDALCFGAETADKDQLRSLASALLSPEFPEHLRAELDKGLSFPVARTAALTAMGLDAAPLLTPNNILAVEYCKAILAQQSPMEPMPILRQGSYHDTLPDRENPSATALRAMMPVGNWQDYVPEETRSILSDAAIHTLAAGERAILCKLRTMTDAEFEALPYGSEGLWRKLMHASRSETALEAIASAVKSKRYTRTRIDRMILCAFLGITAADIATPAPYARVLAFNDRGREILKQARQAFDLPNIGEKQGHLYQLIEDRCDALYGLFAADSPESPTPKYRVYHQA
jgi:predicted nucleotidyltransferase